jgi:hypothetical protein
VPGGGGGGRVVFHRRGRVLFLWGGLLRRGRRGSFVFPAALLFMEIGLFLLQFLDLSLLF